MLGAAVQTIIIGASVLMRLRPLFSRDRSFDLRTLPAALRPQEVIGDRRLRVIITSSFAASEVRYFYDCGLPRKVGSAPTADIVHSITASPAIRSVAIASRNTLPAITAKEHLSRYPSTCGQFFYGFGRQRLAANAPLTAVNLENFHPCHAAHDFAFDRNHGIGQFF